MKYISNKVILMIIAVIFCSTVQAQKISYDTRSEMTILLKSITNEDTKNDLIVLIDGQNVQTLQPGKTYDNINRVCTKSVEVRNTATNKKQVLWKSGDTADEWKEKDEASKNSNGNDAETTGKTEEQQIEKSGKQQVENAKQQEEKSKIKNINKEQLVKIFVDKLERDSFYCSEFIQTMKEDVQKHVDVLKYLEEREYRTRYIQEHYLNEYIEEKDYMISIEEAGMESYVKEYLKDRYPKMSMADERSCMNEMLPLIRDRITERKETLSRLKEAIGLDTEGGAKKIFSGTSIVVNIIVVILLILIMILIMKKIRKRGKQKRTLLRSEKNTIQNAKTNIIVRRKTTSILKKQSLGDVHHNNAYLQINSADFCENSAVRRIYFKNTCIKDIYNMYAEDLRQPDNPREDGCMVLGRWVRDEENDEYYVSFEEIVKPGDDAVFREYELNFGGKIKLKVADRLRRLRRETNLQYDMTCWVHSHPGLGVFFSNADSSVQEQLKNPTHPKFLTAIVIDILTPEQEMGIFTYKKDKTLNSKTDLRKMYSLEELYKWAVESERGTYKAEDYYNLMQNSEIKKDSHYGVELSNGAIIDICQIATENNQDTTAWVHGYACRQNGKTEYIVNTVSTSIQVPDNELLGRFIIGTHCSIPTIKKAIGNDIQDMRFVLFHSTSDGMLISIPIEGNQISVEEKCYGEKKLEDLKIWTRRKR